MTSADGQWGVGNYTYDQHGNLKTKSIGNHDLTYYYSNNKLVNVRGSSNQDVFYDVYGNITSNSQIDFGYNDASQLKISLNWGTVPTGVSPATEYLYDGNGMRVNNLNGSTTTDFVFASNGNLMREYGASASQVKEYFYLGSQQIASVTGIPNPIANAGADQIVNEDEIVTLDGSASSSPDGTITNYIWQQVSGVSVALNNATTSSPSFTAPEVLGSESLVFSLQVSDSNGQTSISDTVSVTVNMIDVDSDGLSDNGKFNILVISIYKMVMAILI